ncbi:MAG TPA: TonB-dependent receptor [Vicinamibacterales bacterium]|nr:TonB-dependent receptor [Vicinamibacterales bacterium]
MRVLVQLVACFVCFHEIAAAQTQNAVVRVHVRAEDEPIANAEVKAGQSAGQTDASGTAQFELPAGEISLTVTKSGYLPSSITLTVAAGTRQDVTVDLQSELRLEETVTVVATTRSNKRIEDEPMRVEVLDREEIEEKLLMTPGDIVMMLNEMGGMRVQATSPSLGAANVRIQGMRGRYTRVLSDGLPLFGDVGGLGLLQIPPMDLGQVEVVKGVASALYGGSAMGGVINLLARRPAAEPERELLINRSSRGATDAVGYLSGRLAGAWSASLLGGGHWQEINDVNGDGWADLAGYQRGVLRPRLFWDDASGRSFFATVGLTFEDRNGGTPSGSVLPATGAPYIEALETRKYDAGMSGQFLWRDRYVVTARAALANQSHDHQFGEVLERDRHETALGELAIRGLAGRHSWIGGLAIERDAYRPTDVPQFEYTFLVPGAFGQYDVTLTPALSLSASGRLDGHSEYGTFFSPRVSALARVGKWTSRASIGTGFFASTPLTEETEAAGLTRLDVVPPLKAEKGVSASFDLTRTEGAFSGTVTLFASRISSPVYVDRSTAYVLSNLADPTLNLGAELLATMRNEPFALTATYTYVHARETVGGASRDVALTPRHSAGIVGMWEKEDAGRLGVEWYYTGRQALEENPYRTVSEPYTILGVLAEKQFGRIRLFVNAENLSNVRQTTWDPLLRSTRAVDGRWTVDAWAPLDGRNINGGVRIRF